MYSALLYILQKMDNFLQVANPYYMNVSHWKFHEFNDLTFKCHYFPSPTFTQLYRKNPYTNNDRRTYMYF